MQRFLLAFCGGALMPAIPWPGDGALVWWLLGGAAALTVALQAWTWLGTRRGVWRRRLAWSGLPLGLAVSALAHAGALEARLDTGGQGLAVDFSGTVIGTPAAIDTGPQGLPAQRFQARIDAVHGGAAAGMAGRRVRLSWYGGLPVVAGETWRWTGVLREPWSYANPGGFDYERWLLGAGLQGTGYLKAGKLLKPRQPGPLERARSRLTELVTERKLEHGAVLLALLAGQSAGIDEPLWQILRSTGTVHLMVISGLHVSLAAALGFAAGRMAGRLCPLLPLWLDVRVTGCLAGAAVAAAYVMLAGAGLPALRAMVMSAVTLALLAGGRTSRLGGALLLALALLLVVEPMAVHQQGFWLSFGAVVILYLSLGHRLGESRFRSLLRAQLALSLGMLPLVVATTGTLPWTGVPANLVAVPVMSLLVVPAVLLGGLLAVVSSAAAGWVLTLADLAVGVVLLWLEWLARAPLPVATGDTLSLLLAQASALCWLLGVPSRQRPALALCLSLPLAAPVAGLAHGEYRVMALDVGQGTAVAIDTRRHRLLYDAGPAFPSGFETGSAVVVPSLAASGAARLDTLVLSHDDIDHVGGAAHVRSRLAPDVVLAPFAAPGVAPCHARHWRWDGVTFRVLDVRRPANASDNDRSCIVLVDDGRNRLLIAGDIGAAVESALLRALLDGHVPVRVMFAPHHGSATSSSRALVRVLQPRLVLVSAGRGNRFGHPHPDVVARYRRVGARVFQTGREGALIWRSGAPAELVRWRRDRAPYWRAREEPGRDSSR